MTRKQLIESAVTKIVKRVLKEAPVSSGGLFNEESIKSEIEKIKSAFRAKVPVANASAGSFDYESIYLLVVFDPKDQWANGIMENANYYRARIESDGTVEVFTQSLYKKGQRPSYESRLPVKFRKTKAKSVDEAIAKLMKFTDEVKAQLGQ